MPIDPPSSGGAAPGPGAEVRAPRAVPVAPGLPNGFAHHVAEPALGEVVVSEQQIRDRIAELGAQITADYRDDPPLLVCVLKGAFVFLADLARAIRLPI